MALLVAVCAVGPVANALFSREEVVDEANGGGRAGGRGEWRGVTASERPRTPISPPNVPSASTNSRLLTQTERTQTQLILISCNNTDTEYNDTVKQ